MKIEKTLKSLGKKQNKNPIKESLQLDKDMQTFKCHIIQSKKYAQCNTFITVEELHKIKLNVNINKMCQT